MERTFRLSSFVSMLYKQIACIECVCTNARCSCRESLKTAHVTQTCVLPIVLSRFSKFSMQLKNACAAACHNLNNNQTMKLRYFGKSIPSCDNHVYLNPLQNFNRVYKNTKECLRAPYLRKKTACQIFKSQHKTSITFTNR